MSNIVKITEEILQNTADAIREKKEYNSSTLIKPINFPQEISDINTNGKTYTVNITQSEHQTIYVEEVSEIGSARSTSFTLNPSTHIPVVKAYITPDTGYNKGTLNVTENQNITLSDTTPLSLNATAATIKTFTVTIQNNNAAQLITVTCNGVSHTTDFTCNYGDTITCIIELINTTDYRSAGTLNITQLVVTDNVTISASYPIINETVLELSIQQIAQFANAADDTSYSSSNPNKVRFFNLNKTPLSIHSNWTSLRGTFKYSSATTNNFNPLLFKDLNYTNLSGEKCIYLTNASGMNQFGQLTITDTVAMPSGYSIGGDGQSIEYTNHGNAMQIRIDEILVVESNYTEDHDNSIYYDHNTHELQTAGNSPILLYVFSSNAMNPTTVRYDILNDIANRSSNTNTLISRGIFNFKFTDIATGYHYVYGLDSSYQQGINTISGYEDYRTMDQGYSDTGLYDIEMFGFRMYHVEDNEWYDDFYQKFESYVGYTNINPDTAKILYRLIIQKEIVDKLYSYLPGNTSSELAGQPVPFKLIFR